MAHTVTLISGDGTGPEITEATRRVLEATGVEFIWDVQQAGAETLEKSGTILPEAVLDSIKRTGVGLKGPITTPVGRGVGSGNIAHRKKVDLNAHVGPSQ